MIHRKTRKPGRNALCPCGSGLKYKKCHGASNEAHPFAIAGQADLNQLLQQGQRLAREHQLEQAERWLQAALQRYPLNRDAWFEYARLADQAGDFDTAAGCYRKAIEIEPRDALSFFYLGNVFLRTHDVENAAQAYDEAIAIKPDLQGAWQNLANLDKYKGHFTRAISRYRRAIELEHDKGERARRHSSLLSSLHYACDHDADELFSEHLAWADAYARELYPDSSIAFEAVADSDKLRVGYLSGSFNGDILFYFLVGVFSHHDSEQFELYCYSSTKARDEKTDQLKKYSRVWRDISELTDSAAAALIRDDKIDILVDLDGHSPNGRPLILARRAAPIQVEWLDWFNTSGMDTIDYIISDPHTTPPNSCQRFVEEVARLPYNRFCYSPPDYAPSVRDQGVGDQAVTFGSFNRHDKIGPDVIACWAELLTAVPRSRLLLKNRGLQAPALQRALRTAFGAHGVGEDQLDLRGPSPHSQMLQEYAEVDIALDTFPYSGGLTSCESLWMGVPIVALEGERMLERQTSAFLRLLGMEAWIAADRRDYVRIAREQTAQITLIRRERTKRHERMRRSALCDCARFTKDLEALYRTFARRAGPA